MARPFFPSLLLAAIVAAQEPFLAPVARSPQPPPPPTGDLELRQAIDAWLDQRWDAGPPDAICALLDRRQLTIADLEIALRAGRAAYPEPPQPLGKLTTGLPLPNDYVDHETRYMVHVPPQYDAARPQPLLVVMHGGSANRDLAFGERAARSGLQPFWLQQARANGWLVLAPISDRGWMFLGNSILMSALSKIQRDYHIDPDRIWLTGHSMGGHMTWRSSFQFPDRWAAVSPMSGGYDYVKSKDVHNLANVPGYTTYGSNEPYQIREFNDIIATWMQVHGYPWTCQRKDGGHEIFADEVPKVAAFFSSHARDLYRPRLFVRMGAQPMAFTVAETNDGWGKKHTWRENRPIAADSVHWLRCAPPAADTPPEQRVMTIAAARDGNTFTLISQFARRVRILLHPKMVDFGKPIVVQSNGKTVFDGKVAPDPRFLLELVREFDDRGRIFHAQIEVALADDQDPGEPQLR